MRAEPKTGPEDSGALRRRDLHHQTLFALSQLLRRLLFVAALVGTAGIAWEHWLGSGISPPLIVLWATLTLCAAAAPFFGSPRAAGVFATVGLTVSFVVALAHFGPVIGAGLVLALTLYVTHAYFGRRGGLWLTAFATAALGGMAGLAGQGLLHPVYAAEPIVWLRTMLFSGVLCVVLLLLTNRFSIGLVAAVDARRRAEAERTRVAETRAQERELAGRLVGGIVHDVNNSLTVILACAAELAQMTENPRAQELVDDLNRMASAAAETSRSVLRMVRPPGASDEAVLCDPAAVLASAAKNLRRVVPEDVKVELELGQGRFVPLRGSELLQLVVNLVLNAADSKARHITISLSPIAEQVHLVVRDDGVGMSAETSSRAWEPYFTTKGDKGTGLGLTQVRSVVERAGGQVRLDSTVGHGATIRLILPSVPAAAAPQQPRPEGSLAGKRVLLVEDEVALRNGVVRYLTRAGAVVHPIGSVEAFKALPDGQIFDALWCDGVLGDGSAADVIPTFHRRWPSAKVLLCSAHDADVLESRGIDLNRYPTLPKPFTGPQAVATLAGLLGAAAAERTREG